MPNEVMQALLAIGYTSLVIMALVSWRKLTDTAKTLIPILLAQGIVTGAYYWTLVFTTLPHPVVQWWGRMTRILDIVFLFVVVAVLKETSARAKMYRDMFGEILEANDAG